MLFLAGLAPPARFADFFARAMSTLPLTLRMQSPVRPKRAPGPAQPGLLSTLGPPASAAAGAGGLDAYNPLVVFFRERLRNGRNRLQPRPRGGPSWEESSVGSWERPRWPRCSPPA